MTNMTGMANKATLSKDDKSEKIDVTQSGVTQQVFLASGYSTT
jgi:hypothetical protein